MKIKYNKYVCHLLITDDQVILDEDAEDVTCMFCKLMDTYTEWGLKIHV